MGLSSRRRQKRVALVAWARRGVEETAIIGGMSQKGTRRLEAEGSVFLAVQKMFAERAKRRGDVYKDHREVLVKENFATLGIGAVVSYIIALLAIKFFIGYLQKHGFKIFGWYRIVAGAIVLVLLQQGIIK